MPILKKIVIQDFRNIELQEVDFSSNVNCISGGNGEGKTNLLDAIWHLAMTKSAFSGNEKLNFRYGTDGFSIAGEFLMENGVKEKYSLKTDSEGKRMRRADKQYTRISDHIGTIPVVIVSPADTTMVSEAGEERRRFVNASIAQMDRNYLCALQQYNRVILQRNKALRESLADDSLLDVFDAKLSEYAEPVFEARKRFAEDLSVKVGSYYERISGGKESVGLEYRSELSSGSLKDILKNGRERDKVLKFTYSGIHRDDFPFTMDGRPIRRCGSQGQQKSFLVALKFAQYDVMKNTCGKTPILLLDDLFDKLDIDRVGNLLMMVSGSDFGQIFITDSNKVRMRSVASGISSDIKYLETIGGTFKDA